MTQPKTTIEVVVKGGSPVVIHTQTAEVNLLVTASAANLFYRAVRAHVQRLRELEHDLALDGERIACALSCVINSVCWVEAFANETCAMCHETPTRDLVQPLPAGRVTLLGLLWEQRLLQRTNGLLDKVDLILRAADKSKLDRKHSAVTMMHLLARFRNEFCVHAGPTHFPAQVKKHRDLEQELRNVGFETLDTNTVFFPYQVLTAGCAEWAMSTAKNFCDHVCDLLGLARRFDY